MPVLRFVGSAAVMLLTASLMLLSHYWMSAVIVKRPLRRRDACIHYAIWFVQVAFQKAIVRQVGISGLLTALLANALAARYVFGGRGLPSLMMTVRLVAGNLFLEVVCSAWLMLALRLGVPYELLFLYGVGDLLNPVKCSISMLLTVFGALQVIGLLSLARRLLAHFRSEEGARRRLYLRIVLRMAGLIVTGLGTIFLSMTFLTERHLADGFLTYAEEYIPLVAMGAGLLLISISYLIQDMRYIAQLQRNETLERQQAISRSLLANLRFFRHNIINMLYGFEGVIIAGDAQRLRAYYDEMTRKCALVNNENIVALERVSAASVSAVLLRAIDRARQEELPLNLYVQDGVRMGRGMAESDLCQVLGVLLDNAVEAALQAQERSVFVEMRNVEGALEILVRNTYAGQISEAQLRQGGRSGKQGHSGQGLLSCYDVLSRQRAAFLNFQITGQYVQAQLLIS